MSYTKTDWKSGDIVTANKLNNMEDGIASAGGAMVVTSSKSGSAITLSSTWQEIFDAMTNGKIVLIASPYDDDTYVKRNIVVVVDGSEGYEVSAFDGDSEIVFTADSASGYPQRFIN